MIHLGSVSAGLSDVCGMLCLQIAPASPDASAEVLANLLHNPAFAGQVLEQQPVGLLQHARGCAVGGRRYDISRQAIGSEHSVHQASQSAAINNCVAHHKANSAAVVAGVKVHDSGTIL